jgi:hypothetical protein
VFPKREDSTGDLAMREIVAPPGSKATSRTEGKRWNMRGPTGSVALVRDGGHRQGDAGVDVRAEVGSRIRS